MPVALHQTSDSYINAQMAKTGWQDRAPYMSSPEADALKSMVTPQQVSGPDRPSLELGVSQPWFSLGSYSKMKYTGANEFVVPDMKWSLQMPYPKDTDKPQERFANAEYSVSHNTQSLRSIPPPQDLLNQLNNMEKAFQDLKKDKSNENNVKTAEYLAQQVQELADAAAPLIKGKR